MDAADVSGVGLVTIEAGGKRPEAGGKAARAWDAAATVVDPEIPVLTIEDLGVLRGVSYDDDGTVVVAITPTYSGCPAMQLIEDQIAITLDLEGIGPYRIETVYSPAWTTDWMTDEAREKLRSVGIAPPPGPAGQAGGRRPEAEGPDDAGPTDEASRAQVGVVAPLPAASRRVPSPDAPLTVAPPNESGDSSSLGQSRLGPQRGDRSDVLCPRCSSDDTRTVSEFGSTACKALMVCSNCGEPFDFFKRLA